MIIKKILIYVYDEVGNRIEKVEDHTKTTYTYNSRNQLVSEESQTGNYRKDFFMLILYGRKQIGFFCTALGLICSIIGFVRFFDSIKEPLDFNIINESEMKIGAIVEGDIPYNFGKYAYVDNRWDGFIIPIKSEYYYSLHVKSGTIHGKLMQQSRDTIELLNNNSKSPQIVHFKGNRYRVRIRCQKKSHKPERPEWQQDWLRLCRQPYIENDQRE